MACVTHLLIGARRIISSVVDRWLVRRRWPSPASHPRRFQEFPFPRAVSKNFPSPAPFPRIFSPRRFREFSPCAVSKKRTRLVNRRSRLNLIPFDSIDFYLFFFLISNELNLNRFECRISTCVARWTPTETAIEMDESIQLPSSITTTESKRIEAIRVRTRDKQQKGTTMTKQQQQQQQQQHKYFFGKRKTEGGRQKKRINNRNEEEEGDIEKSCAMAAEWRCVTSRPSNDSATQWIEPNHRHRRQRHSAATSVNSEAFP